MRRTSQTLLEQMQISDVEIARRKELLGLKVTELGALSNYRSLIEENIDKIVDLFYEKQTAIDEISLLIGDADTLQRLRNAQRRYVIDLFSGVYDGVYVNNRLRIGMVHKRIGVEPKLYLSAMFGLKEIIFDVLKKSLSDQEQVRVALETLDKLLQFDTTLVFDTYIDSLISEIETAKKRTEEYAKSLEDKVAERTAQLEVQAQMDPLTNLFNQRAFQEALRKEFSIGKRREEPFSVLYIDVDHFKQINDTYGHAKGDDVLRGVASCLLRRIRKTDLPCRYGGDEFCIIMPNCSLEDAISVGESIISDFDSRYAEVSISIGAASTGPHNFIDEEVLIKKADEKMYEAKAIEGSNIKA